MLFFLDLARAEPLTDDLDLGRPELADLAWPAFGACAGGEPPSFERLQFGVVKDLGAYSGATVPDDHFPWIFLLEGQADEMVVLHEIAHLWVDWSPRALNEGLAQTLAECVYQRLHGDASPQAFPRGAPPVEGLVSWEIDAGLSEEAIQARYLASYELAKVLEPLLSPEQRWSRQGYGWPELWEMLWESHGLDEGDLQRGENGWTVDPRSQDLRLLLRSLLPDLGQDLDGDGLDAQTELALDTHPLRWDTDGDGWWDGANPPQGAVVVHGVDTCGGVVITSGDLRYVVDGPDLLVPDQRIVQVQAGQAFVIEGMTRHRVWFLSKDPLRPCSDTIPPLGGSWPMQRVDPDEDMLVDARERELGTDPTLFDTDGDGWWDGATPPRGAVPFTGSGWRCLGIERWLSGSVSVGGPDAGDVQAWLTKDNFGRRQIFGLRQQGPPQARAWLEIPRPEHACPDLIPLSSDRQCIGVARRDGRVKLPVGPGPGALQYLVDGEPQPVDPMVHEGQRIEAVVRGEVWWVERPHGLAPCPEPPN